MSSITTADIRSYTKQRMDAGAEAATINEKLAVIKRMFTRPSKARN